MSLIVLPAFAIAGYGGAGCDDDPVRGTDGGDDVAVGLSRVGQRTGSLGGVLAVFLSTPYFFQRFTIYPEIIGRPVCDCRAVVTDRT